MNILMKYINKKESKLFCHTNNFQILTIEYIHHVYIYFNFQLKSNDMMILKNFGFFYFGVRAAHA